MRNCVRMACAIHSCPLLIFKVKSAGIARALALLALPLRAGLIIAVKLTISAAVKSTAAIALRDPIASAVNAYRPVTMIAPREKLNVRARKLKLAAIMTPIAVWSGARPRIARPARPARERRARRPVTMIAPREKPVAPARKLKPAAIMTPIAVWSGARPRIARPARPARERRARRSNYAPARIMFSAGLGRRMWVGFPLIAIRAAELKITD